MRITPYAVIVVDRSGTDRANERILKGHFSKNFEFNARPLSTFRRTALPRTTVPRTAVPRAAFPRTAVRRTTFPRAAPPRTAVPRTTVPRPTVRRPAVPRKTFWSNFLLCARFSLNAGSLRKCVLNSPACARRNLEETLPENPVSDLLSEPSSLDSHSSRRAVQKNDLEAIRH